MMDTLVTTEWLSQHLDAPDLELQVTGDLKQITSTPVVVSQVPL